MSLQRFLQCTLILSATLTLVLYFYKDKLPPSKEYQRYDLSAPKQEPTTRDPFTIVTKKQSYTITPRFDYELTGVVVTYNNSDGFTDIWHQKRWKDYINLRDLCVIWGPNVASGIYNKIEFSSDSWTCWVSWKDSSTSQIFKNDALSNNHLLTNSSAIKTALRNTELGDVIHFKGVLADYKNNKTNGRRGTSVTRTDRGNGACETVFLDEFRIVKKANPTLRMFYRLSKWIMFISLIALVIVIIRSPYKPYQGK